jgi:hypothetical protein
LVAAPGYAHPEDRAGAKTAGFPHHFAKPIEARDLAALLQDVPRK